MGAGPGLPEEGCLRWVGRPGQGAGGSSYGRITPVMAMGRAEKSTVRIADRPAYPSMPSHTYVSALDPCRARSVFSEVNRQVQPPPSLTRWCTPTSMRYADGVAP